MNPADSATREPATITVPFPLFRSLISLASIGADETGTRGHEDEVDEARELLENPAPISPADLSTLAALRQTVFALESVLMLAGSRLPPASVSELVRYVESGKAAIERAEGAK